MENQIVYAAFIYEPDACQSLLGIFDTEEEARQAYIQYFDDYGIEPDDRDVYRPRILPYKINEYNEHCI